MNQSAPCVLLVDDEDNVRRALSRLLTSAGYRVTTFSSARAFLDAYSIQSTGPACVVLDVRLPDLNGLRVQRELQSANAILPIIFITGHGDVPMCAQAMKAGAVDFLTKPVQAPDLLRAIERSVAWAEQAHREKAEREGIRRRFETLTFREREVMELVITGRLNKQIASDLGTVEATIKVHRARVMEKMQVKSLAELVHLAERAGIGREDSRSPVSQSTGSAGRLDQR